jgi:hypothetical protein
LVIALYVTVRAASAAAFTSSPGALATTTTNTVTPGAVSAATANA